MNQTEFDPIKENKGIIVNNQFASEFNTVNNASTILLPFDVSKDLNQFNKIFVRKTFNPFRTACCFEKLVDYEIFGELPDGDKKLLFTCQQHFECCKCCDNCFIDCCLCGYNCCDIIKEIIVIFIPKALIFQKDVIVVSVYVALIVVAVVNQHYI